MDVLRWTKHIIKMRRLFPISCACTVNISRFNSLSNQIAVESIYLIFLFCIISYKVGVLVYLSKMVAYIDIKSLEFNNYTFPFVGE